MTLLTSDAAGVRLRVHVQPRASRTELAGQHGDALKVRVAAPPVDGAANDALVRFLADVLGVARSAVSIEAGGTGRSKVVRVAGVGLADAARRLGL
ncbi:MAG TPA: DUF167 domain-containing protein [Gemmatimonadales bacterium]|nr:DUF167 domain-containing protein [Gemmatimonadales bacterium]